jgi:hypothetical protein
MVVLQGSCAKKPDRPENTSSVCNPSNYPHRKLRTSCQLREFELVTLPAAVRAVVQVRMKVKRPNHRSFAWYSCRPKHMTTKNNYHLLHIGIWKTLFSGCEMHKEDISTITTNTNP